MENRSTVTLRGTALDVSDGEHWFILAMPNGRQVWIRPNAIRPAFIEGAEIVVQGSWPDGSGPESPVFIAQRIEVVAGD